MRARLAVMDLVFRPANEVSWDDIRTVFGERGDAAHCWCQRHKSGDMWHGVPAEALADRLREQTNCGDPGAEHTSGFLAYLDGEPVAWCAIEPRPNYDRLLGMPIPWKGRDEDKTDDGVWAVTCFVVRKGYRLQGISYELAREAVEYARRRGARALEAYPIRTEPGKNIIWGEVHVGAYSVFEAAGFRDVTHPTKRRYVVRVDFDQGPTASPSATAKPPAQSHF